MRVKEQQHLQDEESLSGKRQKTIENLEGKLEERQKLLECIRPFFAESRRKYLIKKLAVLEKCQKKVLESNWNFGGVFWTK